MADSSRPTLGATRSRQGRLGRPIVWVLLFGTLLAAIGLFAAWTWKSGDLASTERSAAVQQSDAKAFKAPEPAPQVTEPYARDQPAKPATAPNP